jgi:cytochrome c peroxidase
MFKVPQLRNIAQTGPYFHDGAVATLEQAVTLMGKHQLGKDLSPDEVGSIVTFLKALDGTVDPLLAKAPTLP